ncbi:hypothetical protein NC653_006943 [Populus alba x Populus x berolinensis]|uniref:Uncharacterized protein n=1 Tax=Populus alba x Populus x berolinensis TaxID=444605 RepID=A0AAD6RH37_9ROSI|nr:hypothetical protein NC653_006943 [Populus alba x Populus x berolinensis]
MIYLFVSSVSLYCHTTSGRPVRFLKTIIGCGHKNNGPLNEQASSIVGLGGGSLNCLLFLKWVLQSVENSPTVWCLFPPRLENRAN